MGTGTRCALTSALLATAIAAPLATSPTRAQGPVARTPSGDLVGTGLAGARAEARAFLLASGRTDEQAVEPGHAGALDWQSAPFTRRLVDNAALCEAAPDAVARAPTSSREGAGPFRVCPACGRLYWPAGRVRRMSERLPRG